jgi:hypothetical protein
LEQISKSQEKVISLTLKILKILTRLPDDLNFMPTLGNGHLGFTVFSDSGEQT